MKKEKLQNLTWCVKINPRENFFLRTKASTNKVAQVQFTLSKATKNNGSFHISNPKIKLKIFLTSIGEKDSFYSYLRYTHK